MSQSHSRIALLLALALPALAACGSDRHDQAMYDHRLAHPISAEPKAAVLVLEMPAGGQGLSSGDAARLGNFSRDYVKRGDGAVELVVGARTGAAADAEAFANGLIRSLAAGGVGTDRVVARVVVDGDIPAGAAVLRYRQWAAVLPDCGRWDENVLMDPTNTNSPNFGCATQHNVGAMVSNPRTLMQPYETQPREGIVGDRVISKYGRGEDTTTFRVKSETSGGSK